MNMEMWEQRLRERTDLVTRLTHLTRGDTEQEAFKNLWNILTQRKLIARNDKGINFDGAKVCCFQEIPLYSIAENLRFEKKKGANNVRYSSFGIRVLKGDFFCRGGRPVVYADERLKAILKGEYSWSIVSMNLNDTNNIIDWSHEREWRIDHDYEFEYDEIEIIVSTPKYYRLLVETCLDEGKEEIIRNCNGIIVLNTVFN